MMLAMITLVASGGGSDNLDFRHGENQVSAAGEKIGLALHDARLEVPREHQ
ncbi:MAG: hypothetical protein RLY70_1305, partial [Planctomycetota bacterium]